MKGNTHHQIMKNAHLEGGPFLWEAGPTGILLVHGYTATTAEVRPLAQALYARGYTVSGPVLPGHNSNPVDINKYSWRDWVAVVEEAYQVLFSRCDQVFLGGESTGGLLAMYLAPHHPDISGLLTYAPALKLRVNPFDQLKLRLAAPFIPYLPKTGEDDDLPWKGYTVNPLKGVIQLLKLQKQVLLKLDQIRRPILIVQGKLDTTVDPNVPQTIYNGVSSNFKEIYWMEKSSHCVIIDCEFDQVVAITQQFISKVQT
jgi:carboxylesterase